MATKKVKDIQPNDYVYIGDLIKCGKAWYPGYKGVAFGEDEVSDAFFVYADNMWLLVEEIERYENEIVTVGCEEYAFTAHENELVEYTHDPAAE